MGHTLLARLPGSRKWREVVDLLDDGAAPGVVASAAAVAAERDLEKAADDPVFVEALRLLALILIAGHLLTSGAPCAILAFRPRTVLVSWI